jgi:hypothetical protein
MARPRPAQQHQHRPAAPATEVIPVFDEPQAGLYVYLCDRCGQPLAGPHEICHSALHVGTDGLGVGRAVRSTELARLAGAARAALGGVR